MESAKDSLYVSCVTISKETNVIQPTSDMLHHRSVCGAFTSLSQYRAPVQTCHRHARHRFCCLAEGRSNFVSTSTSTVQLRITTRKLLKQLSSLELAIGELAAIAGLSVVGSLIKQNEAPQYYVQNFPGLLPPAPPQTETLSFECRASEH